MPVDAAQSGPPRISVREVTKEFEDQKRGLVRAVDRVSFEVYAGEIFGLLGPNGAGKTTTLRMLSTMLQPTSGEASICGHDVTKEAAKARRMTGFLSGATGLYERSTARELLRFFGRLFSQTEEALDERIEQLGKLLTMQDFLDAPCGKLSAGQRQKVSIARSIIHDPPVLILDEPTANLDILVARDVLDFVLQEKARGKAVLFSTHTMSEVDRLCDRVAIIHYGRVLAMGDRADLAAKGGSPSIEEFFFQTIAALPAPVTEGVS